MIQSFGASPFRPRKEFVTAFNSSETTTPLPSLASAVISISQNPNNDAEITIMWSAVPLSQNYRIMVNGLQIGATTETTFKYMANSNMTYMFEVKAFAEGYKYSISNHVSITISSLGTFLSTLGKYITANFKKILINK